MAIAKTNRAMDLDAIGRLEDKIKQLVELMKQMREEQARLSEENLNLSRELEAAREKLAEAETTATEFGLLKEERDAIRTRVADMLGQLEALSL